MRDLEKTVITELEPEPARPTREDRRLLRDVKRQAINQQQLDELRVYRERLAQVDAAKAKGKSFVASNSMRYKCFEL